MSEIRREIRARIEAVEESYEFFLAYAAQGVISDRTAKSGQQLRAFLRRSEEALEGLADRVSAWIDEEGLEPVDAWRELAHVLERDARASRAAIRVVRAQASISSQLVDNLNASIHLRALLTDLFLLDEAADTAAREVEGAADAEGREPHEAADAAPQRTDEEPAAAAAPVQERAGGR